MVIKHIVCDDQLGKFYRWSLNHDNLASQKDSFFSWLAYMEYK